MIHLCAFAVAGKGSRKRPLADSKQLETVMEGADGRRSEVVLSLSEAEPGTGSPAHQRRRQSDEHPAAIPLQAEARPANNMPFCVLCIKRFGAMSCNIPMTQQMQMRSETRIGVLGCREHTAHSV